MKRMPVGPAFNGKHRSCWVRGKPKWTWGLFSRPLGPFGVSPRGPGSICGLLGPLPDPFVYPSPHSMPRLISQFLVLYVTAAPYHSATVFLCRQLHFDSNHHLRYQLSLVLALTIILTSKLFYTCNPELDRSLQGDYHLLRCLHG